MKIKNKTTLLKGGFSIIQQHLSMHFKNTFLRKLFIRLFTP